jgi:hypothetical protein
MKNTRKTIARVVVVTALAAATGLTYAFPPGQGPGAGGCAFGGGPGMMGWGGGPGMMGYGPRGGPGMMGSGGMGPRGGWGPGRGAGPAAHAEAHLAFLKTELKITGDQEAAWQAYATQMKQQAESMQARFAQAGSAAQSAPDRMQQRAEFARQRVAAMESMSTAMKNLYAVLTPEQQAIADQHFGGQRMARGYGRWR